MTDLLVTGGKVVTAERQPFDADIAIDGGVVTALLEPGTGKDARRTIDATGRVVLPGLLDPHVHPGVYVDLAEDLPYVSRFAALGGITTMIAFYRPQDPYRTSVPAAKETFSARSHIDFGFILGVTQDHNIAELALAQEYGVNAFKFYLGYCGHEERFAAQFPFTDEHLVRVMEALAELPGDPMLCVHCENASVSAHYQNALRDRTEQTLAFYDRIHPVVSELDAAARVTLLGDRIGIRTCVVHVSAGSTAAMLEGAPWVRPGRTVRETCMHYLTIDVDDPAGLRAVVRPPVREREEVERLWEQVLAGNLDTIGSDNCASVLDEKVDMDVWSCRLGFGELGLTLPLLLHEGHHGRGMPLQQIAAMTSRNVAVAHGMYPRKGTIRPGSDADLVIVDLDLEQPVDPMALKGRPEGSVYAGRTLRGWPVATILGGEVVAEDGEFIGELGRARFIRGV